MENEAVLGGSSMNEEVDEFLASKLLTAEQLVDLRKPVETTEPPTVGEKFYRKEDISVDDQALQCHLDDLNAILNRKRVARICDLMQAEWVEGLKVAITAKLKGKFAQRMGHLVEGGVALYPEEAVFLLENGYMEIYIDGHPLSTEEAYEKILKGRLDIEKYQVYNHLSQLGFIVVKHQQEVPQKPKSQVKKKNQTASTNGNNVRLNFTDCIPKTTVDVNIEPSETEPRVQIPVESVHKPVETHINVESLNELLPEKQDDKVMDVSENTSQSTTEIIDTAVVNFSGHFAKDLDVKEGVNSFSATEAVHCPDVVENCSLNDELTVESCVQVEMDKQSENDSLAVEVSVGSSCNVEVNSTLDIEGSESESSVEQMNDDEICILEVKIPEKAPMAVIDILSEDEPDDSNVIGEDNDDEIQVIKVCSNVETLTKSTARLRAQNIRCKLEGTPKLQPRTVITNSMWPFPELAGKDIACLPRPPPNLIPPNVHPSKEAYTLDLRQIDLHGDQPAYRPRVWNSYRDLKFRGRNKHPNNWGNNRNDYPNRNDYTNRNDYPSRNEYPNRSDYSSRNDYPNRSDYSSRNDYPNRSDYSSRNDYSNRRDYSNRPRDYRPPRLNEFQQQPLQDHRSLLPWNNQNPHNVVPLDGVGGGYTYPEMYSRLNDCIRICSSMLNMMHTGMNAMPEYNTSPVFRPPNELPSTSTGLRPEMNFWGPMNNNNTQRQFPRVYRPFNRRRGSFKNNVYPCDIPRNHSSHSWGELKSTTQSQNVAAASSSSVVPEEMEVPVDANEVLWNRTIKPLVKAGERLPIEDVCQSLRITQQLNLYEKGGPLERNLPNSQRFEISFDVYLPDSTFKKSDPGVPAYRIVVVKATDDFPKSSEVTLLLRKFNDRAVFQFAVVDNGEISFMSMSSVDIPPLS